MESNMNTTAPQPRHSSARIWLVIAYLLFTLYATGQFGALFFSGTANVGDVTLEALFIHIGFITLYGILTTLPMLMVIGYQRNQVSTLKEKIREDLWLCGLDGKQLASKMQVFGERNSWGAFILPAVLTMIFLAVMWSFFLMPAGQSGLKSSLGTASGTALLNVPAMMQSIADSASVIMMTFLGAYFYILSVMIRRWLQADLTTGVLWKINVRLAAALLVGFLLAIPTIAAGESVTHGILLMIGFLAGIVPDTVLRWLSQRARQLVSPQGEKRDGLFGPSDLQEKIEGLNFWQADRLFEEGIESIQDLAMKEIPDLLIETRFDTPHILYWVDQALLSNQVGEQGYLFHDAFIKTASDLTELAGEDNQSLERILRSIQDGQQNRPGRQSADGSVDESDSLTLPLLENIVEGLRNGPNLPYARAYWANTNTPKNRASKLAELEHGLLSAAG